MFRTGRSTVRNHRSRSIWMSLLFATVLAMAGPAGAQDYPVTQGTLSVGSSSVAPGGTTTFSGGGCAPGAAVTVTLGGSNVGTATASAAGDFSATATIPSSAASGTMSATCRTSDGGSLVLSAQITIDQANTGGTNSGNTSPDDPPADQLAFSGAETWVFASVGSALALAGAVMLAVTRRTRLG